MVVGTDICVESIEGTAEINLVDQTLFLEDVEISIDRTHTQIRELLFQPFVDPVGGRVNPGVPQHPQDSFALPTAFVLAFLLDRFLLN